MLRRALNPRNTLRESAVRGLSKICSYAESCPAKLFSLRLE